MDFKHDWPITLFEVKVKQNKILVSLPNEWIWTDSYLFRNFSIHLTWSLIFYIFYLTIYIFYITILKFILLIVFF